MDSLAPVVGLDDLERHLHDLLQSDAAAGQPPLLLNAALLDDVSLQLTEAHVLLLAPRLLPLLVAVLRRPIATAVPPSSSSSSSPSSSAAAAAAAAATAAAATAATTAVASLATKLLAPVTYAQALTLASAADLVDALGAGAAPATNVLAMTVLHKAAVAVPATSTRRARIAPTSHADLAHLAGDDALLAAFVVRWLAAPAVEVGEAGVRVLGDLLDVDSPLAVPTTAAAAAAPSGPPPINGSLSGIAMASSSPSPAVPLVLRTRPGPGALWRRLFRDPVTYQDLLLALCTGRHPAVADDPRQQSIAQGRVLRLLPRLAALNLADVATAPPGDGGLLQFAVLRMVDRSDVLLHRSLVESVEALVSVLRVVAATAPPTGRAYVVEVLRALLRAATADDALLAAQLRSLPERTVPDEADDLRAWLREVLPASATRVAGWAEE